MSIRRFEGKIDGAIRDPTEKFLAWSGGEGASRILTAAGKEAK